MDPALEKLGKALEKSLRKGPTAKAFLTALSEATEILLHLDLGMLEGAVLPRERREALTTATNDFARDCLVKAATLDAPKASRWLSELAIYRKPKTVDFAEWARLVEEAKTTGPAPAPLDLSAKEIPEPLARAFRTLVGLGAADPAQHRLSPPASEGAIAEREKELGFPLPGELRFLYRLCDGFALFRREGSIGVDGSPFRLVPLHQLQPFAWTTGDELPKRKRKAKARSLEEAIGDPARLQVFDLGNGDFVSCVENGTSTLWIDDYSDGPQKALTDSLAVLLEHALSAERAWEGLRLQTLSK